MITSVSLYSGDGKEIDASESSNVDATGHDDASSNNNDDVLIESPIHEYVSNVESRSENEKVGTSASDVETEKEIVKSGDVQIGEVESRSAETTDLCSKQSDGNAKDGTTSIFDSDVLGNVVSSTASLPIQNENDAAGNTTMVVIEESTETTKTMENVSNSSAVTPSNGMNHLLEDPLLDVGVGEDNGLLNDRESADDDEDEVVFIDNRNNESLNEDAETQPLNSSMDKTVSVGSSDDDLNMSCEEGDEKLFKRLSLFGGMKMIPRLTLTHPIDKTEASVVKKDKKIRPSSIYCMSFIIIFIIFVAIALIVTLSITAAQSRKDGKYGYVDPDLPQSTADPDIGQNSDPSALKTKKPTSTSASKPTATTKKTSAPVRSPTDFPSWSPTTADQKFDPILINCGGSAFTDTALNNIWLNDQFFIGGNAVMKCSSTFDVNADCSYRIWKDGAIPEYAIPLASSNASIGDEGSYFEVRLHFVEIFFQGAGRRVFDVVIEDEVVYKDFDIFANAGAASILYIVNTTVYVDDGMLNIKLSPSLGDGLISGIEIRKKRVNLFPTSAPTEIQILVESPVEDIQPDIATIYANATYQPGYLTENEEGLLLSAGLTAKLIAKVGRTVEYVNGLTSEDKFLVFPDGAACFIDNRPANVGGWIYVINSEVRAESADEMGRGGVSALTFDKNGNVVDYKLLLRGTTANCGGGRTPWGSWVSCEEATGGEIYQVDPNGIRPNEKLTMGSVNKGLFESFAFDVRDPNVPRFYATKDDEDGEVTRFTPTNPNWTDPWTMLHGPGSMEYLVLYPESGGIGKYEWITDLRQGKRNASRYFPNTEGMDAYRNELFFVSKKNNLLFTLNLDGNDYMEHTTKHGLFSGQPDQIVRLTAMNNVEDTLLYFTEDGGENAGLHARNPKGQYFTILESSVYSDETTGLSFSPDGKHIYIAYQDTGLLFDVTRKDGLPFSANTLNLKYHNNAVFA